MTDFTLILFFVWWLSQPGHFFWNLRFLCSLGSGGAPWLRGSAKPLLRPTGEPAGAQPPLFQGTTKPD